MSDQQEAVVGPSASAPHLAVDLEAERSEIRRTLTLRHVPLEGKGQEKVFSLAQWDASPFRQIVEELLVAYTEISSKLATDTVQGDLRRLQQFLRFLADTESLHARAHTPMTTKDLSFTLIRDFEHWLAKRPKIEMNKSSARAEALRRHLQTHALPRQRFRPSVVHVSALNERLGFPRGYIERHSILLDLVRIAAERQGLTLRKTRRPPRSKPGEPKGNGRLAAKAIEEIYYTLSKTLRHIERNRRDLLADDFALPALNDPQQHSRRVKSPALSALAFERFLDACRAAVRRVKTRLLVDGPARVARGRPDPVNEADHLWGRDLDNLIAYLAKYAPRQIITQVDRPQHRRYLNAILRHRESPTDIARWLHPGPEDLTPFLLAIGSSEHAPLNLASLLGLWVDEDDPKQHCVRDDSPTPGHMRVYFGKPRAGVDQAWVDVPARSSLDIPGLIDTVVAITRPLRAQAPSALRHHLWLYLSNKRGLRALTPTQVTQELVRSFIAREGIRDDDDALLQNMYYRRLRPTVLSNVAFESTLEAAQRTAAHADPIQTFAYASSPGNEARVRKTVKAAQSKAIAAVRAGFRDRPPPDEVRALAHELGVTDGRAAEIILGHRDKLFNACVDDKNGRGPEIAGRRCGKFEACLVCVNSVILARHLPRLIAYYLHWLGMTDSMDEEAWRESHELNCAIVEEHLTKFDPDGVARLMDEARALPQPIAYRRFKQS